MTLYVIKFYKVIEIFMQINFALITLVFIK